MQVDFYQLTVMPLDRALPQIAEKVLASGARLLVVADDADRRAAIDTALWIYAPDSFLPHGQGGGAHDGDQPVLIAATPDPANGARMIALIDGVWRNEALSFDRAFHFFDEETVAAARLAWKGLADKDGVERRYWKLNDQNRWQQIA